MLSKIKKIFFMGIFGILYVSFVAQLIYACILFKTSIDTAFIVLGLLTLEWLVLISARYLSKKSAGGREHNSGYRNDNFRR